MFVSKLLLELFSHTQKPERIKLLRYPCTTIIHSIYIVLEAGVYFDLCLDENSARVMKIVAVVVVVVACAYCVCFLFCTLSRTLSLLRPFPSGGEVVH